MNNFDTLIEGDKPVVVDFSAEWCGPCKMMPPILSELKRKVGDTVTIIKMDIDKNPSYAQKYTVMSVPTLIIFQHGKILWRRSGVTPAHEILQQLEKTIN
jgi:thioredoxin 1